MTDTFQIDSLLAPARRRPLLKRDMELVRRILLHVEAKETLHPEQITFDDVDHEVLGRHVEMLHSEDLIEGRAVQLTHLSYDRIEVTDLTWEGHDFAAALREETVWQKLKQQLTPAQLMSVPLAVLKPLAIGLLEKLLRSQVGL
jgi:hypothetical protein